MDTEVLKKYIEENGTDDLYYIPSFLTKFESSDTDFHYFPFIIDDILGSYENITGSFYSGEGNRDNGDFLTYSQVIEGSSLEELEKMEKENIFIIADNENGDRIFYNLDTRRVRIGKEKVDIENIFEYITFKGIAIYKILGSGHKGSILPYVLYKLNDDFFHMSASQFINDNIDNEEVIQITKEELLGGESHIIKGESISIDEIIEIRKNSLFYKYLYLYQQIRKLYPYSDKKLFRTLYLHLFVMRCRKKKGEYYETILKGEYIPSAILKASIAVFRYFGIMKSEFKYPIIRFSVFIKIVKKNFSENRVYVINGDTSSRADRFMRRHKRFMMRVTKNYITITRAMESKERITVLKNIVYLMMVSDSEEETIDKIMNIFGLVTPKHYKGGPLIYILSNLDFFSENFNPVTPIKSIEGLSYRINKIYRDNLYLYKRTDKYILENIFKGMDVGYDNNERLKQLRYKFKRGEDIIFLPIGKRNCLNKFDKDGNDLEDEDFYVFSITEEGGYKCYDFETVMNMMSTRNNLCFDYVSIEGTDIYETLNIEMGIDLLWLVKRTDYKEKDRFISVIKSAINRARGIWKEYFDELDNSEKILLKDFFLGLFYLGMLTRRWNPDDEGYPMREEGTKHGDRDISEGAMSVILTRNYLLFKEHILDRLTNNVTKVIINLQCMTKHGDIIEQETINSGGDILNLIHLTFEENNYNKVVCQRISSNASITTADYYLRKIFDYEIPNFDINQMETIA